MLTPPSHFAFLSSAPISTSVLFVGLNKIRLI
uniref:Cytochrome b6/f complex subunit VI n=1 Tax=Dipteris conjugata TaxID=32108 RepID=A0A0B5EGK2_9MONI|nr:cytochrome b6/f complex subunit VI [Dipteris conjugata]AXX76508.1 cytochrome b6/f complex subunit VI [Dipteris conjugata]